MKLIITLVLSLSLMACAAAPTLLDNPKPYAVVVPVKPAAPADLLACGHSDPRFRFYNRDEKSMDVIIIEKDQPSFQAWIDEKNRCLKAWKDYGQPDSPVGGL